MPTPIPPMGEIQAAGLITAIRQALTTPGTDACVADALEAARTVHGATRYELWRHTLALNTDQAAVYFTRYDVVNSEGTPTPEEQKHIARTSVVRLRERMHFYANLMDPIHQPTATRLRDSANRIETPHE